jgi:hypothetical protein
MYLAVKLRVKRTASGKLLSPRKIDHPAANELLGYKPLPFKNLHANLQGRFVRLPSMSWDRAECAGGNCIAAKIEIKALKRTVLAQTFYYHGDRRIQSKRTALE